MSERKRIAFLSTCIRGGGAGWSLYYLLKHLDRDRIEPIVILPAPGIYESRFRELGIDPVSQALLPERIVSQRFSSNSTLAGILSTVRNVVDLAGFVPWLTWHLRREGVQLLYCNNMLVEVPGALAAQGAGVPCILHARSIHGKRVRRAFYGSLTRLPAVRKVIANSRATAAQYRNGTDEKVRVIHNGVDLAEYESKLVPRGQLRRDLGCKPRTKIVGFTGFLMPRKGLDTLINAAAQVLRGREDVIFAIVGRVPIGSVVDYHAEYLSLVETLGIADRVVFTGFREDVRPAVTDFDILCLPSYQEPFGRSIVEAMALGRPVVASRVGGVPEIITDGVEGLLVSPGQPDVLAQALGTLLDDDELRLSMGRAAQARVREHFDIVMLTKRIQEELLEEAL